MTICELPPDIEEKKINDLEFSNYCLRLPEVENTTKFEECVSNPEKIPRFAWQLFTKELNGCYGISGVVKYFTQKAAHGARVFATQGIYKDVSLLDINSLYPSVLADLQIPTGRPEEWNEKTDLKKCNYYVLELNITETHPCELYPYAKAGFKVLDKYDIEDQERYTRMKYEIVRGYVWKEGTKSVKDFIMKIYNKKRNATAEMKKIYKNILNSIFGKTLQKSNKTEIYKRFDTDAAFSDAVYKYHKRIIQMNYEKRELTMEKPYDTSFNFAYIGTAILSLAKRKMNSIYQMCYDNNIKILYHNTDSIIIHSPDVKYFENSINNELGGFHVEATSEEAVIVGRGLYYLSDGHFRCAGTSHATVEKTGNIRKWFVDKL
jgi:hypothetical protein